MLLPYQSQLPWHSIGKRIFNINFVQWIKDYPLQSRKHYNISIDYNTCLLEYKVIKSISIILHESASKAVLHAAAVPLTASC